MSRHYCHRLFRHGSIHLREFIADQKEARYTLPEAAEDISIHLDDLVVLAAESRRFELTYGLLSPGRGGVAANQESGETPLETSYLITDCDFKMIKHSGKEYRLGDIQARILRQLFESAKDGHPWQNGKKLLQNAGSQSYNLSNVFKRNPIWKELIISDGRGSY